MGTMTAMVAHEFNNILTPIINYAQLARKNPGLVAKAIERAADGGQRAVHICNALLGITGQPTGEPAEQDLAELVGETLQAMARPLGKDGIELDLAIPAGLKVKARRVELQQVLLNLLINARTAVLAKERSGARSIRIDAERDDQWLRIRVTDTGVGVSAENFARLFEPFFTTRPDDEAGTPGHGLGLAICREIMTAMGGDITARSVPNEGTTFTIRLPR